MAGKGWTGGLRFCGLHRVVMVTVDFILRDGLRLCVKLQR